MSSIASSLRSHFRNANNPAGAVATLRDLAARHELQAAHRAEFSTDYPPAAKEADAALDAATHHGIAIGLNTAADLLSIHPRGRHGSAERAFCGEGVTANGWVRRWSVPGSNR
jgi:hypothetical protein